VLVFSLISLGLLAAVSAVSTLLFLFVTCDQMLCSLIMNVTKTISKLFKTI